MGTVNPKIFPHSKLKKDTTKQTSEEVKILVKKRSADFMYPMYPIYAAMIRLPIVTAVVFLIIICCKAILHKTDGRRKLILLSSVAIAVVGMIYILFLHGNIYQWKIDDHELLAKRIISISEAGDTDIFSDESGSKSYAVKTEKDRYDTAVEDIIHPFMCSFKRWKKKCTFIDYRDYRIVIEPAVATRFFTTPCGVFESTIYVVNNDIVYVISFSDEARCSFLQPLIATRPQHDNIIDILV